MKTTIKLGEVACLMMGQSPEGTTYNDKGLGLPFYQGKSDFGDVYPKARTWCSAPIRIAEDADILISVRAPVGPTNLAVERCCIGRGLAAIRPITKLIERDYLWYFLKYAEPVLVAKGQGSTFEAISGSDLSQLEVLLPKIVHQRRIAANLKSQFTALEQARNSAQLQLNELTNLANAIIRQSVEHSDTAPTKLGDVLDEVKKGVGKTWAEYPVLGATRAGLALAKEPVGKVPERYKPVLHGTVFYNPMRIMIGSIAMVDEFDSPGITSPDYVALRGKAGLVDSRWFYYWLRSPYGISCIASLARGAVRERMLFNRLAEGSIELPPYTVQVIASKALAELKPMRTAIEKQLAEINLLPSKILAKAFEI
jgi:type I restriction enzyme S subunit